MASHMDHGLLPILWAMMLAVLTTGARGIDIFLEWNVAFDSTIKPVNVEQPVWIKNEIIIIIIIIIV